MGRSEGIWTELALDALERCNRCDSLLGGVWASLSFSEDRDNVEAFDDLRKRLRARLGGVVRLSDGVGIGSWSSAKLGGCIISCVSVSVRMNVNPGVGGVIGGRDASAASCVIFSLFLRRSLIGMADSLWGCLMEPRGVVVSVNLRVGRRKQRE